MVQPRSASRRRFLSVHAGGAALALLAGCADRGAGGTDDAEDANDAESADDTEDANDTESTNDAGGGSGGSDGDELDLREANVVDVAVEETDGGYAFDVTLHHDDDGEEGYANWWQVERLDGTRLGRRELLHAHSELPFTRSDTVAVPDDVSCVVVRGHDQTHGYGGTAALVDLAAGAVRLVDQGEERRSFDADDCP